MARTCQRFVTYTLDVRLRMAAQIWLATFSTGITQKRPSPLAIAVLTIELFLFVLLGQSVLPFALNWPYVV